MFFLNFFVLFKKLCSILEHIHGALSLCPLELESSTFLQNMHKMTNLNGIFIS